MKEELKVGLCQLTSIDKPEENIEQIYELLDLLIQEKVEMVFLPENSLFFRIKEETELYSFHLSDKILTDLARYVQRHQIHLHIGSLPLSKGQNKPVNSSIMIYPDGSIQETYQKIHLFDVYLENKKPIEESKIFNAGTKPQILDLQSWKFGQTICYDLRFSELFYWYSIQEVDVLLVPAAFLSQTGMAHWEVLLRARAIENQSYLIAAAQGGEHKGKDGAVRETHGQSMIIDPWGKIIAETKKQGPDILVANLSKSFLRSVRQQIPMKNHRHLFNKLLINYFK